MNPQTFFKELTELVQKLSDSFPRMTPALVLQANDVIRKHFSRPDIISILDFEPMFHFKIGIAIDNATKNIRVNCVPQTLVGLDMLAAQPGVVLDESIKKQLRKLQDQQLVQSIMTAKAADADPVLGAETKNLAGEVQSDETVRTGVSNTPTGATTDVELKGG